VKRTPSLKKITQRLGVSRYSAVHLLAALIVLFAATPFIEESRHGELVEAVLLTLVLVSAELSVGGRHKVLGFALLLTTVVAKWSHHLFPQAVSPSVHLGLGMVFTAFVVTSILRFILRAPRVNTEVLSASVAVYFMIGLLWSFAYVLVARNAPQAFSIHTDPHDPLGMTSFNALYFSFTTLSTVGFGDITPISKGARTLAFMEAITGMFYVAILISRLVSMYAPAAKSETPP